MTEWACYGHKRKWSDARNGADKDNTAVDSSWSGQSKRTSELDLDLNGRTGVRTDCFAQKWDFGDLDQRLLNSEQSCDCWHHHQWHPESRLVNKSLNKETASWQLSLIGDDNSFQMMIVAFSTNCGSPPTRRDVIAASGQCALCLTVKLPHFVHTVTQIYPTLEIRCTHIIKALK